MPRGSSRSSSSKSTSRSAAASKAPPKSQTQQNNQVSRPGMASGLMGSLMTGMAFGAGAEFMRGLFRSDSVGPNMMPLILSGLGAFAANRLLLRNHPYRVPLTGVAFVGAFVLLKGTFGGEQENRYEH